MALGLLAKDAQTASGYALLVTPLAFVSGAFIPVGTLPTWLEPIAVPAVLGDCGSHAWAGV
jgi:ABC-2 type transport system permease protein